MFKPTRRVTSFIDQDQQSKVLSDEKVEPFSPFAMLPSFQVKELFYTEDCPHTVNTKFLNKPFDLHIPEGAFRVMLLHMPTQKEIETNLKQAGEEIPQDWKKFNLHNHDTMDYLYVVSGEIDYILDSGETVKLKQGDFLTQISSVHTWINNSDTPCQLLVMMHGTKTTDNVMKITVE